MDIKYFPFAGEDYKPQIGLKSLDLNEWIEIDENWQRILTHKQEILQNHREDCLQVIPGNDEACLELRDVLARHLKARFPLLYAYEDERMTVRGREYNPARDGEAAFEQITTWTQEDWALLSASAPVKLEAATVCFPSRWSLREKIGKDIFGIHVPVPKFETIAKPTAAFLERVAVDKPMWRVNWTIHDSDELFCPGPRPSANDLKVSNILDRTWLRIERQTLRRLPVTKAVVFSIRTYLHPIRDVIAEETRKQVLTESLKRLPADSAEYKGMKAIHALLNAALSPARSAYISEPEVTA